MIKWKIKFVSNNIEQSLICSVCKQPFQDPIDSCCKHTFCKLCFQELIHDNKDCPICQQPFSDKQYQTSINSEIINQKISYLDVQCPNYTNGCKSHLKLIDLTKHVENCRSREIKCPYGCDEKIIFNEKYEHVKTCAKTQDQCPFCQSTIEKAQQKSHYEKICQNYPMKCAHSIYGCQEVVQRKDYNNHLKNCKYHKVRGITVFSEISETMLRMFQDEIDQLNFEIEQLQEITRLIETDNEWKENKKKLFYQKNSTKKKKSSTKKKHSKKKKFTKMKSAPSNLSKDPNQTNHQFQKSPLPSIKTKNPNHFEDEKKKSPIEGIDYKIQNKLSLSHKKKSIDNKNDNFNSKTEFNNQIGTEKLIIQKEVQIGEDNKVEEHQLNTNKEIKIEIEKEIVSNQRTETEKEENDMNQKTNNTVNEKQIEIEKEINKKEIKGEKLKEKVSTNLSEKENNLMYKNLKENENKIEKDIKIKTKTKIFKKINKEEIRGEKQNENAKNESEENEIDYEIKRIQEREKEIEKETETETKIEIEKQKETQIKNKFKLRGINREVKSPDGSDFLRLDDELIFEIMDYLDVFTLFRTRLVNSKFHTLIRNSQRPWTKMDFTGTKFSRKRELVNIFSSVRDVRCLDLTDTLRYCNQRTIAEIIVIVMNFQSLESLSLCKNFCNSLGEMFNILLPENKTLLHLDLSWNFMKHGVVHLATGLSNNFTLRSLDITQNYAKDEVAIALANSLKNYNNTLTELNITSNNIRQEGGNALVEMLKVNNSLKKLVVTSNSLGIQNDLQIKSLLKKKK
ncbi:rich repeat and nacht domain-containing protein [Anaeramoeba flamelloides]|uniref:Rich repeat and nacht domain-containing protein n=1 Tax=Anaeramoeba flamelloides TaxID=1746091 RepID=A0ABQ8YX21_9EUKA|nr:rich repeat and nacht domain-containing protein [Anaeramoeba flamelloides]